MNVQCEGGEIEGAYINSYKLREKQTRSWVGLSDTDKVPAEDSLRFARALTASLIGTAVIKKNTCSKKIGVSLRNEKLSI